MAKGILEGKFIQDATVEEKKLEAALAKKINDAASLAETNKSGLASLKSTVDGHTTTIAGKQDKLTAGAGIGISGNTISVKNVPNKLIVQANGTQLASFDGSAAATANLTAANIGAVPTGRKINNKALSGDITLTPTDIGAAATGDLSGYVPTSRTVNGKALSANITLAAGDVGAPTTTEFNTLKNQVAAIKSLQKMVITTDATGKATMTKAVAASAIHSVHYGRLLIYEDEYTISGTTFTIAASSELPLIDKEKVVISYYE